MNKFFLITVFLALGTSEGFAKKETIFVIESYHKEFGWDRSYLEGIKGVLGERYDIKTYELDTKRLPQKEWEARADEAWRLYKDMKPIAVILGDDASLMMLGKRFETTTTPVVYLGINNNPRHYVSSGKNITGILERPLIKRSAMSIKEIIKDAKNILILFDTDTTSKIVFAEEFKSRESLKILDVSLDIKLIDSLNVWMDTIREAQGRYDAIIVGLYQNIKDSDGVVVPSDKVLEWTSKNSTVPLFGFWDFSVGEGKTVGGLVQYGKIQGEEAALLLLDVLKGKDITKIFPSKGESGKYLFNKKELERFGLELPPSISDVAEFY